MIRSLGDHLGGKRMCKGFVQRRFGANLSEKEVDLMADYFYCNSCHKGSGEYASNIILEPFAFARKPLISKLNELKVPTVFIFGDNDWMDRHGNLGKIAVNAMDGNVKSIELIIPNAGHNLMLDNVKYFNQIIIKLLKHFDESKSGSFIE